MVQAQYEQRIKIQENEEASGEGTLMMATHVLSEDLPPFSTEVYRESLPKMIAKKRTELQIAGFIFDSDQIEEQQSQPEPASEEVD